MRLMVQEDYQLIINGQKMLLESGDIISIDDIIYKALVLEDQEALARLSKRLPQIEKVRSDINKIRSGKLKMLEVVKSIEKEKRKALSNNDTESAEKLDDIEDEIGNQSGGISDDIESQLEDLNQIEINSEGEGKVRHPETGEFVDIDQIEDEKNELMSRLKDIEYANEFMDEIPDIGEDYEEVEEDFDSQYGPAGEFAGMSEVSIQDLEKTEEEMLRDNDLPRLKQDIKEKYGDLYTELENSGAFDQLPL